MQQYRAANGIVADLRIISGMIAGFRQPGRDRTSGRDTARPASRAGEIRPIGLMVWSKIGDVARTEVLLEQRKVECPICWIFQADQLDLRGEWKRQEAAPARQSGPALTP